MRMGKDMCPDRLNYIQIKWVKTHAETGWIIYK